MNFGTSTQEVKRLFFVHAFYLFTDSIANGFIFLFLWRLKEDLNVIALFDLIFFIFILGLYTITGHLIRWVGTRNVIRWAVVIKLASIILVLTLQNNIVNSIVLWAILKGAGSGLYWGAFNLVQLKYTADGTRQKFLGSVMSLETLRTTFVPIFSGYVISTFPILAPSPIGGYYTLFTITIALYLVLLGMTIWLPDIRTKTYSIIQTIKLGTNKKFRYFSIYEFLTGLHEKGIELIFLIFTFFILKNELNIGIVGSVFGTISAIYILFLGQKLKHANRFRNAYLGASIVFVARVIYISLQNLPALLIQNILIVIGGPLFGIPAGTIIFGTLEQKARFNIELEEEYLVARELPLNLGRITGLICVMLLFTTFGFGNLMAIKIWFIALSTIPLLKATVLKKIN